MANGGHACSVDAGSTCVTTDGSYCDKETCYPSYSPGTGGPWAISNGTVSGTWQCINPSFSCSARGGSNLNCNYVGHAPGFDSYTCQSNSCSCTYGLTADQTGCKAAPDACGINGGAATSCTGGLCSKTGADKCCGKFDSYGVCCDGASDVVGCDAHCNSGKVNGCDSVCGSGKVVGGCDNACGSTKTKDVCGTCGGTVVTNQFISWVGCSGNNRVLKYTCGDQSSASGYCACISAGGDSAYCAANNST